MHASRLIWESAGRPSSGRRLHPTDGGWCALCGEDAPEAAKVKDALGTNFTGQDFLHDIASPWVCEACAWAMSGKPPKTLRMWSVVYRDDRPAAPSNPKAAIDCGPHVHLTARNDMREVVDVLISPPDTPWVCTVAVSGQKHLVPYAQANRGTRWTVRFEGADIASTSGEFATVLYHAASLRALGFTSEEILSGVPQFHRVYRLGLSAWEEHAAPLQPYFTSHLLDLCLFTINKDGIDERREAARAGVERHGADGLGGAVRPRGLVLDGGRDQAHRQVGADADRARDGSGGERQLPADGVDGGAQAPDREPDQDHGQLSLFR